MSRVRATLRRRWLSASLRTKSLLVVSVPILPLLLVDVVFLVNHNRRHDAEELLERAHLVKEDLHALIAHISQAESGVRLFLLTSEPTAHQTVDSAEAALSSRFARLRTLIVDPAQRSLLDGELTALTHARLRSLQKTRDDFAATGVLSPATLDTGRIAMVRLQTIVDRMITRQNELLEERRQRARSSEHWVSVAGLGTAVVGLSGGLLAAFLLSRGIVSRIKRVARDAERLPADELISVPSDDETDEIGQLQRTLNTTADLLRARARGLETAQAELDSFFTVIPDILCLANTDGRLVRVNPAWRTLGWSPAQLTGRPYLDFVHPEDRDATQRESSVLAAGGEVGSFENRYATADGSYRWLSWSARLDEKTGLIAAVARDITQRKATDQRLQELNEQLQEATCAKNDFLSRMSHDLRTPLNAVIGFAQLLETDALTGNQREDVLQILNGSRHLLQLIDEVLQIARAETGRVPLSTECVPIANVVTSAVALIRPLAEQRQLGLSLSFPSGAAGCFALADPHRVKDITLNLLSNAVKYNRTGGSIRVTVDSTAEHVRISVADTGFGIPEGKRARLFTAFDRLGAETSSVEGTGLGLTLSETLARAMGGTVGVISEADVGSTFWLELRRADGAAIPSASDSHNATPTEHAHTSGVVLYIDDTQSNLLLVRRVLARRSNVTLLTADRGEDGIRLAKEHRPAMILLDLHLPDIDGDVVLQRLWEEPLTRDIPVIVVSADATTATTERMLAHGAVDYLPKPLNIHYLLRLVDERLSPRLVEHVPHGTSP